MRPADPFLLLPDFLDHATCRWLRSAMDSGTEEPAEVLAPDAAVDPSVRLASSIDVGRSALSIVERALEGGRAVVEAYYGHPLGRREGTGFLRYRPGGFYRRHSDRAVETDWPGAGQRLVSVVVFLNSSSTESCAGEFDGGQLVLFPPSPKDGPGAPICIAPRRGALVAFAAETAHEVKPVTRGVRDVIVDWFY
jgi:predicted 2-oxoglutarate/Fe(II)-dependent dioxygenase YbiX